jgi:hypothetical protein
LQGAAMFIIIINDIQTKQIDIHDDDVVDYFLVDLSK